MKKFMPVTAAALLLLAAQRLSVASSATWSSDPSSSDWNVAANWMGNTVPNGSSDTATFGPSSVTSVTNTDVIVDLDSLVFDSGAPQYSITALDNIAFYGAGILNSSGRTQSFFAGAFFFNNGATAGTMTSFENVGGLIAFLDSSSAGSAAFDLSDNMYQADLEFFDSSTAANATVAATGGAIVSLFDFATGGTAAINISGESFLGILADANADHASATCTGGDQFYGAGIIVQGSASAGEGTFTSVGASTNGEKGAYIEFDGSATAANGTFSVGGGLGSGLAATTLTFNDTTTAAASNITAQGGVGGSFGGAIFFEGRSLGGTATISLLGNSSLDISGHVKSGVTIGSLSGAGSVSLGANPLAMGSNNQSTTFSGVIQGTGSVSKIGTGTLTLSGSSTYTGGTTVSAGTLVATNKTGSATGTGGVTVSGGTLGGSGIISGAVTVNSAGFLAPSYGGKQQMTLTIQSSLTLNSGATYTYSFKAKGNKSKTDKVVANGVTINGATVNLQPMTKGSLKAGTAYTLISNTSGNQISGTFGNLADGAIVNVNGNNLQASYEGGDGNDLTLTVVP